MVHLVDSLAGQIGESEKVLGAAQPLRLKAAHVAGRGSRAGNRLVTDYLTYRRTAA
jgi:hypothetical protein